MEDINQNECGKCSGAVQMDMTQAEKCTHDLMMASKSMADSISKVIKLIKHTTPQIRDTRCFTIAMETTKTLIGVVQKQATPKYDVISSFTQAMIDENFKNPQWMEALVCMKDVIDQRTDITSESSESEYPSFSLGLTQAELLSTDNQVNKSKESANMCSSTVLNHESIDVAVNIENSDLGRKTILVGDHSKQIVEHPCEEFNHDERSVKTVVLYDDQQGRTVEDTCKEFIHDVGSVKNVVLDDDQQGRIVEPTYEDSIHDEGAVRYVDLDDRQQGQLEIASPITLNHEDKPSEQNCIIPDRQPVNVGHSMTIRSRVIKKLPPALCSPYNERAVNVLEKLDKLERELYYWILTTKRVNGKQLVYDDDIVLVRKSEIISLEPDTYVSVGVIK